jgi:hypothetical protein
MTMTREGSRLFAQLPRQPRVEIFPRSETEFFWNLVITDAAQSSVPPGMHNKAGSAVDSASSVHKRQLRVVHFTHRLGNGVRPANLHGGHETQIA